VTSPVRWEDSVQKLIQRGVTRFVEVGPGRVLGGLVRKLNTQVQVLSVEGPDGVRRLEEMR